MHKYETTQKNSMNTTTVNKLHNMMHQLNLNFCFYRNLLAFSHEKCLGHVYIHVVP